MLVFIGKKYCDISTHKWVFIMQVVSYFFQEWLVPGSYLNVNTVKPRFTDPCIRVIWTPHYSGQFALPFGKESPRIFSKFNPLNTDTSFSRTVCFALRERKPSHFL